MKRFLHLLPVLFSLSVLAQYPLKSHPYSTQSETGFSPCRDTFSLLRRHLYYDIGQILPSWLPVVDKNYIAIAEGKVICNPADGTDGPHVYEEDLPFYHYS